MIRRFTAFHLKYDDFKTIFMKSMISCHEIQIMKMSYAEKKAAENQWIHRLHARWIFQINLKNVCFNELI